MNIESVKEIWKYYLDAYGPVSNEEREVLLRKSVSETVVSTNPAEKSSGFAALRSHIEQFQQRLPGAYFENNKLLFHHDQLLSEWTLRKSDGSVLRTAHTYGQLNEEGLLAVLVGFF